MPVSRLRSTTRDLVAVRRVVDDELEHEAVDLRLGQRVGALGLDRVLRREHEERRRDVVRLVADRDLALLHHLEQGRLHLGGRAVDLVREQEVAEHRAELGVEAAAVRPVDARADEVRRDEVGRELQALEAAAEHVRDGLDGQRLGQAGDALEQDVAAGEQRHEDALEHRLLADDHPLDLEQRRLQRVVGVTRRVRLLARVERVEPPVLVGHVHSPGCHAGHRQFRSPASRDGFRARSSGYVPGRRARPSLWPVPRACGR